MFWGLVVQPNKKYSKTVSTPFHVSQAVLDVTSAISDTDVQLILKSDKVDYVLCVLRKSGTVQVPLDLIFSEGDDISFRSVGGTVHLTGYLVDEQLYPNIGEEEEVEVDEEEVPQLVPAAPKKKKKLAPPDPDTTSENEQSAESAEGSDNDDDEDDSEDEDSDASEPPQPPPPKIPKLNGMQNGLSKKKVKDKESKQKKQKQQQQTSPKSTLQGGVKIEDLRVGQGPVAKAGKKVQVYYEGRFKTNNKIFDKTNAGKGFEFVLGRSEVIKGWDVGVQGMKVGGKRRIVCPPSMAYGSKGSPPAIPSNSTLVFDVELRGIN